MAELQSVVSRLEAVAARMEKALAGGQAPSASAGYGMSEGVGQCVEAGGRMTMDGDVEGSLFGWEC